MAQSRKMALIMIKNKKTKEKYIFMNKINHELARSWTRLDF